MFGNERSINIRMRIKNEPVRLMQQEDDDDDDDDGRSKLKRKGSHLLEYLYQGNLLPKVEEHSFEDSMRWRENSESISMGEDRLNALNFTESQIQVTRSEIGSSGILIDLNLDDLLLIPQAEDEKEEDNEDTNQGDD